MRKRARAYPEGPHEANDTDGHLDSGERHLLHAVSAGRGAFRARDYARISNYLRARVRAISFLGNPAAIFCPVRPERSLHFTACVGFFGLPSSSRIQAREKHKHQRHGDDKGVE